jgi:competence protein ComEC
MHVQPLIETINQLLPEPQASLLAGMLFGVKTTMPKPFYEALLVTGTIHVIALSGMNVSIIIRLLFDALGIFFGRIIGVALTLFGIGFYVWLVGPSPTIVRASIMGGLTIVAAFFGRPILPLFILTLTGIIMLLFDPLLIKNTSFQLSFLATLGIILLGNRKWIFEKKVDPKDTRYPPSLELRRASKRQEVIISKLKQEIEGKQNKETQSFTQWLMILTIAGMRSLRADLKITLSAQAFTFPVIAITFHRISLISPIANLFVGWLVAPITYLGFVMLFFEAVFHPLGQFLAYVVWAPLTVFIEIVNFFSRVPFASVSW